MKKALNLILIFSLILSVLAGCNGRNVDISSSLSENTSSEIYAQADGEVSLDQLTFYDPKTQGYVRPHMIRRGTYGNVYHERVDASGIINRIIPMGNVMEPVLNHRDFAPDDLYVEHNIDRLPYLYILIRQFNISKSDFKKSNQKEMSAYVEQYSYMESRYFYFFTDEEIDLLYSADTEAVKEYFSTPWTIIHNGKTYPLAFFKIFDISRWKEENIPIEKIEKLFESFKKPVYLDGEDGTVLTAETDKPLLDEKLAEYEKLLANG